MKDEKQIQKAKRSQLESDDVSVKMMMMMMMTLTGVLFFYYDRSSVFLLIMSSSLVSVESLSR